MWPIWGHLEAATASGATKMAVAVNMHIVTRVIKVADFKSEFKCKDRGHLEAAKASEDTKTTVWYNMHMDTMVMKADDFQSDLHSLWSSEGNK